MADGVKPMLRDHWRERADLRRNPRSIETVYKACKITLPETRRAVPPEELQN